MNFRKIAFREVEGLLSTHNNYSIGEVLYSILRLKSFDIKVKDLKDITDEEFYSLVEKARKVEADDL